MAIPHAKTADGFEMQIGTNHLGHFALTNLLLPAITDRVVTVSSGMHRRGVIDFDDLNWDRRPYDAWAAYGQSKLANLLFTLELARRLQADESDVRATAAHPGYASTNLQGRTGNKVMDFATSIGNRIAGPVRRRGRAADPVRRHPGPAVGQLRRVRTGWPRAAATRRWSGGRPRPATSTTPSGCGCCPRSSPGSTTRCAAAHELLTGKPVTGCRSALAGWADADRRTQGHPAPLPATRPRGHRLEARRAVRVRRPPADDAGPAPTCWGWSSTCPGWRPSTSPDVRPALAAAGLADRRRGRGQRRHVGHPGAVQGGHRRLLPFGVGATPMPPSRRSTWTRPGTCRGGGSAATR